MVWSPGKGGSNPQGWTKEWNKGKASFRSVVIRTERILEKKVQSGIRKDREKGKKGGQCVQSPSTDKNISPPKRMTGSANNTVSEEGPPVGDW